MGTISLRFRAGEFSYVLRMESSSYPPEIRWVIPRQLARSSRPGNPAEEVEWPAVNAWVLRARWLGIQTIISFLTDEEVGAYYGRLPVPLHRIYGREGFTVMRVPLDDHLNAAANHAALIAISDALPSLPSPWLVHCSAGVDRTGMAVKHIVEDLGRNRSASDPA